MKTVKMIGSALLLISFFLPWMDVMIATLSGFDLPRVANGLADFTGQKSAGASALYVLYLIPILSVATLIASMANKNSKILGIATGAFPLLALAYMFAKIGREASGSVQFGVYLTVISAAVVLLASFAERSARARHSVSG